MDKEKYKEMMNAVGAFVINELNNEDISPEMVSAISELIGQTEYFTYCRATESSHEPS
ncbi:hypothetical protein [Enterococcus avium]|uniref:hypothetical protein n=1 Tax=Enterococcus avium TaxID=33945 RepID=UPI001620F1C8|nr:hypothetical protein [Enterococcus avium]MDT2493407.1 hypothetical protein [Enterococcus avium]